MERTREFHGIIEFLSTHQKRRDPSREEQAIRNVCRRMEAGGGGASAIAREIEKIQGMGVAEEVVQALRRRNGEMAIREGRRLEEGEGGERNERRRRTGGWRAEEQGGESLRMQREGEREKRTKDLRIVERQISEIGKMVFGISSHVAMQGEKVQRVDDILRETEEGLRGGRREIERVWESVKEGRRGIIVLMVLLGVVVFLVGQHKSGG